MTLLDWFRPTVRTRRARYGTMSYFARDQWHGRAFQAYGEWSESEVALWRKIVQPGDAVVDVGAHIGAHTLALASLAGRRVYAFEPQRGPAELLARNVRANGLDDVVYRFDAALGAEDGRLYYERPDYRQAGNFGGVELGPHGNVEVLVRRLDDILPAEERVSFIKVDVEGAELSVLRGAHQTIIRHRPALYVEADRPARVGQVIMWLHDRGYKTRWHVAPLFNPDNFDRRAENIFPEVVSLNLLAIPRDRAFPSDPHLTDRP